jgi:predicted ATPase
MINALRIHNFKCFEDELIPMRPLTVLSGINGMGKSSLLQSLLLLRQSVLDSSATGACLNGALISLGNADDVLYESAQNSDTISFTLTNGQSKINTYSFAYRKGEKILPQQGDLPEDMNEALFGEEFYYLKAERIGPRTAFDSLDRLGHRYNRIGNAGEYCAWLLAEHERKPIGSINLLHQNEPLNELRCQVEAWLSEIGQNPRIHLDEHHSMDLVSMQFSFMREGIPSGNYRPTNVGFGLTYTLPIFVASLLVKPGGMLVIENPEAHLHPKGQSAMGRFLCRVASCGVQVIVETHSDHLLNGIRISAKQKLIEPADIALNFFYRKPGSQSTNVTTPNIDQHGRLDHWPEDFFDEWEKGLVELL